MTRITLATLPQATAQQVFDQVATHLLTQNAKSENEEGYQYHSDSGLMMCAAGCLIAATEWDESLELNDWTSLVLRDRVPEEHAELISALQHVHDSTGTHAWPDRLAHVAKEHGLEFTP